MLVNRIPLSLCLLFSPSRVVNAYPTFANIIVKAIQALKVRNGSSYQAIAKYILSYFNVNEKFASICFAKLL